MHILFKAIYRFSAIPIKIPMTFLTGLGKIIPKFIWKHKRAWTAKESLNKKNQVRGFIQRLQNELQNIMVLSQNHTDQWNKIECPEITLFIHLSTDFLTKVIRIETGYWTVFSINGTGKIGYPHAKKLN